MEQRASTKLTSLLAHDQIYVTLFAPYYTSTAETSAKDQNAILVTQEDLVSNLRSCFVRAPREFGLTSLGRRIALDHYKATAGKSCIAFLDGAELPHHKHGILSTVRDRCEQLGVSVSSLAGFVIDNWLPEKKLRKAVKELTELYSGLPVILLHGIDDCSQISQSLEGEDNLVFPSMFLWALNRTRIREMVTAYLAGVDTLDEELVTKKVVDDIDALNIHRTPLNCLLILKIAEQAFDDTPVNRTEMIGRVLYLLFFQFDKIPRYATRPDLKDCEYALGYFSEWLIRENRGHFTKNDFYSKVGEYCTSQIIDLDIEVLFAFLATENIFVRKGYAFEFRFSYWLSYFAAHRMHHDEEFARFILSEARYSANPEIVEFYAGIDRRRSDAVTQLTHDLKRMSAEFLTRTGIVETFNPFSSALWEPTPAAVDQLEQEVRENMAESTLPPEVKDSIADQSYNRAKPYNQALARFIEESSLRQMMQAIHGASRVLRNSDHVAPEAKMELLEAVMNCWTRVCQILAILSPVLASERSALFEGICFLLDESFDGLKTHQQRWENLMSSVADNIVDWFQEDIFSKRMGALFSKYVRSHEGALSELLVMLIFIRQRPPGWEKEVERFVIKEKKNSFYLHRVFTNLWRERKISFSNERTRQELRRLTAMALAKHWGAKRPNLADVKRATEHLEKQDAKTE